MIFAEGLHCCVTCYKARLDSNPVICTSGHLGPLASRMPVHQHCLLLGGSCDLRTELELRRIAPFIKMGSLNWANAIAY